MLYSAEKGNPTSTFRGKTWQLPTGLWRACNYNGQQCSFKLYNEAIRFAAKGKVIEEAKNSTSYRQVKRGTHWKLHSDPKFFENKPTDTWAAKNKANKVKLFKGGSSEANRRAAAKFAKSNIKEVINEALTRDQVWSRFRNEILPGIKKRYEQNGRPDKPARREAWNNYVDSLVKDGSVTEKAADSWGHPRGLETEAVALKEARKMPREVRVIGITGKGLQGGQTYKLKKGTPFGRQETYNFITARGKSVARFPESSIAGWLEQGRRGDHNGLIIVTEAYPRDPREFNPSGAHLMPGGKSVKTKKELKYSRSKNPVTVPAGTTIELKFSKDKPQFGYFQYSGGLRATQLALAHKSLTGISKPPSIGRLQKMGDDGIATTPTGKRTEPDGYGSDGSPSWLLVLGMI